MASNEPDEARSEGRTRTGEGVIQGVLRNRWFVGCALVLAVLTAGFEIRFKDMVMRKAALPLRKELAFLDHEKLSIQEGGKTYRYRLMGQPIKFPPEMVEALGTDQYIVWNLERWNETDQKPMDERFNLSVTYYTGNPDQVPHVPETCRPANGDTPSGDRFVEIKLEGVPEKDARVPVKCLLFEQYRQAQRSNTLVMYTFRVNDLWKPDRDDVRAAMNDIFSKHSYFSKVEVTLPLPNGMSPEEVDKAIAAGTRFMQAALPVLLKDHFPEWPEK